ncbi:MAG: HNH endonuclease [Bacteroidota bacterium]
MYKKVRIDKYTTIDEHRNIMQNHLGRKLSFNEIVRHKDNDKSNNDLSNLEVITRANHIRHHIKNGDMPYVPMSKEKRVRANYKLTKLKPCEVIYIKYSDKKPKELMQEFNISKFCVSRIRLNKSFAN